jgi:PAS domain S-box-containing protein
MALNTTEAESGVRAGWPTWRLNRLVPQTEQQFLMSSTWLLATSLAMIFCYVLNIANPGIVLMVAVVHSGLTGGWKAGLASAGLATAFTAIYLSEPHRLLSYTSSDAWQLAAMASASGGTVLMIRRWRRRDREMVNRLANQLRDSRESLDSEKAFQSLANDAPVLLWISDEAGRRMYFNRSWINFTGASQAEQIGERWKSRIHPEDRAAVDHRYTNAVRRGESFEAEYRIRSASGEYRWLHDTGVPHLSEEGRLVGYLGCAADRTERKETEAALHRLSGRLLELQDDERRRIARELHDTTAQNLAALSMHLFTLHQAVRKGDQRAQWAAQEGLSLAEQCTQEIRTLSYLLHPPLLDELGLVSALRSYANGFMQRTAVKVDLKIEEIGRMPADLETTIFRIVQEALTNVHRHSGSLAAEVRVIRDPKEVQVIVKDEGRGIPPEKLRLLGQGASLGVGVAGMGERASQLGGNLKIASSEQGTTITVVLPCGGTE